MDTIRDRVIKEFDTIVRIDSISFKEEKMFAYLKKRLSGLPVEIKSYPYKIDELGVSSENLFIRLPANDNGRKKIFFDSHVDTVEPGVGIKPVIKEAIITSTGDTILGADDKSGTASMIIAIEEIIGQGFKHGDLFFLFTSAEEVGLIGIRYIDFSVISGYLGFVLDSGGPVSGIVTAGPNHYNYEITVTGLASHAGMAPEKGISAIKIAAGIVSKLPQGRISSDTTANVGIIEGGRATNIVPDECIIRGEFRSLSRNKINKLKKKVENITGKFMKNDKVKLNIIEEYAGFSFQENEEITCLASEAVEAIGLKPDFHKSGGGSHTNIYNSRSISTVTIDVGMENPHTKEEYIKIEDLVNTVRLILKITELA